MGFIRDIKDIKLMVANSTKENLSKAKKYDELKKLTSNVSLSVKNIVKSVDSNGNDFIRVTYNVPDVILYLDDNGDILHNPQFYAINMLDLISNDDMQKLADYIADVKK